MTTDMASSTGLFSNQAIFMKSSSNLELDRIDNEKFQVRSSISGQGNDTYMAFFIGV